MRNDIDMLWGFSHQAWVPLVGCVLTLALGAFVWFRRERSLVHWSFAALNAATALWGVDVFLLFTVRDADTAAAIDRLLQIPIVSIPFLGLFFIFAYLGKNPRQPLVLFFGGATVGLWILSDSTLFISGWKRYWFGYYGQAGPLYLLFIGVHLAAALVSSFCLWREYRSARDHLRRNRAAWLLAVSVIFCVVSLDNFGPLYGRERLPVGNLAAVFYFFIIAVSIVRYQLLDVRKVFRYGLIYSVLTFLLTAMYLSLALAMQGWLQAGLFDGSLLFAAAPALVVALAATPLRRALQERLDRRFFPGEAVMRERSVRFANRVRNCDVEEEIWKAAWEEGWSLSSPAWAEVAVRRGPSFAAVCGVVSEGSRRGDSPEECRWEETVEVAGKTGLLGLCRLGKKKTGTHYLEEERSFFRSIAAQCAVAVERVRLFEEGRKKDRLAALGEAAAVVAHELRNPLSVIRGATALLRTRAGGVGRMELLDAVEAEVRRTDRFVRDFLSACREPRPRLKRFDLGGFLRNLAEAPLETSLQLAVEVPEGAVMIEGDRFQLERVFRNLIGNAAEGGADRCLLRLDLPECGAGEVLVTVTDDGPGFGGADRSRLFEPFRTNRTNGTGLGLSIARSIVEAHRGTIEAEDSPSGGAVFAIRLPPSPASPGGNINNTIQGGVSHAAPATG